MKKIKKTDRNQFLKRKLKDIRYCNKQNNYASKSSNNWLRLSETLSLSFEE